MEHLDDAVQETILRFLAVDYPQFQSRPALKKQLEITDRKYLPNVQFLTDLGYITSEYRQRGDNVHEGTPEMRITAQGIMYLKGK